MTGRHRFLTDGAATDDVVEPMTGLRQPGVDGLITGLPADVIELFRQRDRVR